MQAKAGAGYDNFTLMSQQSRRFFNATLNYNQLAVTTSTASASRHQNDLGVITSTDAPGTANVYGVKSDLGTTDGYLALPMTTRSTEFFVAAWPYVRLRTYGTRRSNVICVYVCVCVCLSVCLSASVCPQAYLRKHSSHLHRFLHVTCGRGPVLS